ncbi:hypothetical protein MOP88_05285 [Sphingomonas sp. WKB10]|nr:hypothetical protein [Sphingomonas sp. WKB10]
MTRHVALAALMLAACSSQPQADATPTRTPEATPHGGTSARDGEDGCAGPAEIRRAEDVR